MMQADETGTVRIPTSIACRSAKETGNTQRVYLAWHWKQAFEEGERMRHQRHCATPERTQRPPHAALSAASAAHHLKLGAPPH